MRRLVVLALLFSLAHVPAAFAGESLLESGKRAAQALAEREPQRPATPADRVATPKNLNLQDPQGQPGLATSGLGRRSKIFIAVAAAVGFAGLAYAIDQGVEDNTPSSLGLR